MSATAVVIELVTECNVESSKMRFAMMYDCTHTRARVLPIQLLRTLQRQTVGFIDRQIGTHHQINDVRACVHCATCEGFNGSLGRASARVESPARLHSDGALCQRLSHCCSPTVFVGPPRKNINNVCASALAGKILQARLVCHTV